MAVKEVRAQWNGDFWTPEGVISKPKDYLYLPAGDGPLTRAVKNASGGKTVYVVMEKKSRHYPAQPVGLWAPADVITSQRTRLERLRTPEHADRLARQRERLQEREIEQFTEAIRLRYPDCPEEEATEIAEWTCRVGSGRVGRSSTADDPVRAAVVAHIRHEHTDYDRIMEEARECVSSRDEMYEAKISAREEVRDQIDRILELWEQGVPEDTADLSSSTSNKGN